MNAKFFTKDSESEIVKHSAPQALAVVILGLILAAVGVAASITVATLKSIVGGGLMLVATLAMASILLYYGFYGVKKSIKNNTILMNTKTKETVLTDDMIIETITGESVSQTRELSYAYVRYAKFSRGLFTVYFSDSSAMVFSSDSIVEGEVFEVREFLSEKFEKDYSDKKLKKEIIIRESIDSDNGNEI